VVKSGRLFEIAGIGILFGLAACNSTPTRQTEAAGQPDATFVDYNSRTSDVHWPAGFRPEQADVFAHNDIFISAPCHVVFANLIDAQRWPTWYSNSHAVQVLGSPDGKLYPGARFLWDTFGTHIESRVNEFIPDSRLGWFGDGTDVHAYHTFLLVKTEGGCHVITEEVVKGPGAVELRQQRPSALHNGHDLWLKTLKTLSETSSQSNSKPGIGT
jgi:hypothetical protein